MNKTNPILIRSIQSNEYALLSIIAANTFRQTYASMMNSVDLEEYITNSFSLKTLDEELRDSKVNYFLAEDHQLTPIGYGKLSYHDEPDCIKTNKPGEISRIYIDQKYHHLGYGKKLFEALLGHAKKTSCTGLWLSVWENNINAQQFYRRLGFTKVGAQIFMVGDDPQQDDILFLSL